MTRGEDDCRRTAAAGLLLDWPIPATFEIYVTPFPETGARWLIGDGTDPSWSPDGSEIYYRNGSRLMAARLDSPSGMRVLSRRLVVESFSPPMFDDYDVHPDGRRWPWSVRSAAHSETKLRWSSTGSADFRRLVR